ncbi:MAG: hypothetical protein LBB76_12510 [Azoarcus sp.]|jgi:hypothetical protein|nr:hypothetical protein [Azoarcus sp.]
MSLLRFYLIIGGAGFDAEKFSVAAKKNGVATGRIRYTKNREITLKDSNGVHQKIKIECGLSGTDGDGYFTWKTNTVEYITDEMTYFRQRELSDKEYARLWLQEERAILAFLEELRDRLPHVSNYSNGDYFIKFKAIYGDWCPTYSVRVIKVLSEIGAGIEIDTESPSLHLKRIKQMSRPEVESAADRTCE